jgi:acyl-CoA dehydrogenase
MQKAFDELYQEIRVPGLSWFFHGPVAMCSRLNRIGKSPSDDLGHKIAQAMQLTGDQRDRMSDGIYIPHTRDEAMGKYEYGLKLVTESAEIYKKLYKATKSGELKKDTALNQVEPALKNGVISNEEADLVRKTEEARLDAVLVDEFTLEEYDHDLPAMPGGSGLRLEDAKEYSV